MRQCLWHWQNGANIAKRPKRLARRSCGIRGLLAFSLLLSGLWTTVSFPTMAVAAESAAVVMYHRFGEKKFPSTNIRLEQFEEHIRILTSGPYTVLPIPDIIAKMKNSQPLPARTIGISIDDAYRSTFNEAWPRLKKAKLPFTVFVSTHHVDRNLKNMMTWDQIRTLVKNGVTIGHHTASHLHMADKPIEQSKRDIEEASARFKKELGFVPKIFAYPYGEASKKTIELVRDAGFQAAFGQHSGAFDWTGNEFYLPRFAMNETYGSASRFKTAVNSIALPVAEITPDDPLIMADNNPPAIGFTITKPLKRLKQLTCYASHDGRAKHTRLGDHRIEVRVEKPFPAGRTRLNCTLPANDGRWYWFGWQYYRPKNSR